MPVNGQPFVIRFAPIGSDNKYMKDNFVLSDNIREAKILTYNSNSFRTNETLNSYQLAIHINRGKAIVTTYLSTSDYFIYAKIKNSGQWDFGVTDIDNNPNLESFYNLYNVKFYYVGPPPAPSVSSTNGGSSPFANVVKKNNSVISSKFTNIPPTTILSGITANNDVLFAFDAGDQNAKNNKLWWLSLTDGLPTVDSKWQYINTKLSVSLSNIVLFFNKVIIYYFENGRIKNLSIPLYYDNSDMITFSDTLAGKISSISTFIDQSTEDTEEQDDSEKKNTKKDSKSKSENNSKTDTNSLNSENKKKTDSESSDSGKNSENNSKTSSLGTKSSGSAGSKDKGNTNISNIPTGAAGALTGLGMAMSNGVSTDIGVSGINGNLGNKDNVNDFMKNANLLGNNIYVSPMNNQDLYNPQKKLSQMGKITSSFFPMVKIA